MKKEISKGMVLGIGLMFVSALLVVGCATTEDTNRKFVDYPDIFPVSTNGGTVGSARREGDRFVAGDQVTVKFSGTVDQIPPHEERIKDDGTITLPLIGAVKAEGKTPGELQKEITDRYVPDLYRRLTVTVQGEQRFYYVGGQVRSPGRQFYVGATTVTKAVQSAGDFTDFAAKWRVELTREGKTIKVDCDKVAKDPSLDLEVYPGDKIHVPQRNFWDLFR
ncbi:MAG TPA: polysaccharide biosynthesis/export family protein [Verrucomicrobiae bacterium]|nr:polysaccharide biosynthesis/export family protein [Verrucomicrobiae bacterium]